MVNKIEPYKGISNIYDEIRPNYPERLIEDIVIKTKLKKTDQLLEIGAGTGKATIMLAQKGYSIDAIELGEDMAKIFKTKCTNYPNVSLDIAPFEKWNNHNGKVYDMIYSAQAFHWMDTDIKYKKCAHLLKKNGYLVLFWYNTSSEISAVDYKIAQIIEKYSPKDMKKENSSKRRSHAGATKSDERKAEIKASKLFEIEEIIEYTYEVRNDAKQYLRVKNSIPTFASILDQLTNNRIEKMNNEIIDTINENGGYVSTTFNFSLYITKKIN